MNRFKGKISTMNKDGHLGVVQRTSQPIEKKNFEAENRDNYGDTSNFSKQYETPVKFNQEPISNMFD